MADAALDLARSGTPDPLRVQRLQELAARLQSWWLRRATLEALLRCSLMLAVPALALMLCLPPIAGWILAAAAGLALLGTGTATWRAWQRGPLRGSVLEGLRAELAGQDWAVAADELATWLECQQRRAAPAWVAWLEGSLDRRLPQLDAQPLQTTRTRPLGRLRWLLWPAILLALAWLWLLCFAPTWPGLLGGAPEPEPAPPPPPSVAAADEDEAPQPQPAGQGGDQAGDQAVPQAPPPELAGMPQQPVPQPTPQPEPPPKEPELPEPPQPPAPLLDLPGKQHFVVPDHIADGPTTRQRMHAAEAPETATAPPAGPASAAKAPPPPPQVALREAFDRAAEAAQQARHVPAAERPLVQRYFRLLQEVAR